MAVKGSFTFKATILLLLFILNLSSLENAIADGCESACQNRPSESADSADLDSYCSNYKLTKLDMDLDYGSLALGTVTFGLCAPACITGADYTACTVATVAGDAYSVANSITMGVVGAQYNQDVGSEFFGSGLAIANTLVGGASMVMDVAGMTGLQSTLIDMVTSDAAQKEATERGIACIGMGLTAASLALTAVDVAQDAASQNQSCSQINSLHTLAPRSPQFFNVAHRSFSDLFRIPFLSTRHFPFFSQAAEADEPTLSSVFKSRMAYYQSLNFNQDSIAAYLAKQKPVPNDMNPMAKIINQMPNTPTLLEKANEMGIKPAEVYQKIKAGTSPFDLIGLFPNISPKLKQYLQQFKSNVENYLKDPKKPFTLMTNNTAHLSEKLTTLNSGMKTTDAALQNNQQNPNQKDEFDPNDIWHAHWKGLIFEIISKKIKQNRDQVEALEWSTPLNRALNGLPYTSPPLPRQ